jgi:hypothetical protein
MGPGFCDSHSINTGLDSDTSIVHVATNVSQDLAT